MLEEAEGPPPIDLPAEVARILAQHAAERGSQGDSPCEACMEEAGAGLTCDHCDRMFHALCLSPPALTSSDVPDGQWSCPCCGEDNLVRTSSM